MSDAAEPNTLPDFQAIGTLAGTLVTNETGRHQLVTPDGVSLKTYFQGWVLKRLSDRPELREAVRAWTVYPKTDKQGKLYYVYVVSPGGQPNREVDEFHISGRVSAQPPGEGLIGVRIEPNQPITQPEKAGKLAFAGKSFPPFYINLHGYLAGDIGGEIWRFICQREGNRLELIDGARVKERLPQKAKGLTQPDTSSTDSRQPAEQ